MIQQEGVRVSIPIRAQGLVDQLAALSYTNLKHYASKVEVQVIPQPTREESCPMMEVTHETHHTQSAACRPHPKQQPLL